MRKISTDMVIRSNKEAALAGFKWKRGHIRTFDRSWVGDRVVIVNLSLFEHYFPGVLMASLDGTSLLVRCSYVARKYSDLRGRNLRREIIYNLRRLSARVSR